MEWINTIIIFHIRQNVHVWRLDIRICVFSETFDKISVNKYYSRLKFLRKPSKQMTPIVRVNFEPCQLFIIPRTIWSIEKKMWIKYIVSYIILRFTLYLTFN